MLCQGFSEAVTAVGEADADGFSPFTGGKVVEEFLAGLVAVFAVEGASFASDPIEFTIGEFLKGEVSKGFAILFPGDIGVGDACEDGVLENEFVKDESERPDVGAKIDTGIACQLLWAHIAWSAHALAQHGGVASPLGRIGDGAGDAEVDDLCFVGVAGDENVGRF